MHYRLICLILFLAGTVSTVPKVAVIIWLVINVTSLLSLWWLALLLAVWTLVSKFIRKNWVNCPNTTSYDIQKKLLIHRHVPALFAGLGCAAKTSSFPKLLVCHKWFPYLTCPLLGVVAGLWLTPLWCRLASTHSEITSACIMTESKKYMHYSDLMINIFCTANT